VAPTAPGVRRIITYVTVLLSWGFAGMDLLLAAFAFPATAAAFGVDEATYGGLILTPMIAASAVGGLALGHLADAAGRRRVLALGVALYSGSTAAVALLPPGPPGLGGLAILRLVTGFGVGGVWATGFSLIREAFPTSRRRGLLGGFNEGFFQVGFALAGLLAALSGELRGLYLSASFPLLLVPVILLGVPESEEWLRAERPPKAPMAELLGPAYRTPLLLATALATAGFFTFYLFITWLPAFLLGRPGFDPAAVALLTGGVALGNLAATTFGGYSSDLLGRRRAFALWSGVTIGGLGLFAIALGSLPALLVPGILLWASGIGYFGIYGVWFTEIFPTRLRSTGAGFAFNVGRGVSSLSPLVVAVALPLLGLGGGMALALLPAALMVPLALRLPETRGREGPPIPSGDNQ
jgi:MFS family permease